MADGNPYRDIAPDTTISAPLRFATLKTLGDALTNAFTPSADHADRYRDQSNAVKDVITRFDSGGASQVASDPAAFEQALFGEKGVLNISFEEYWNLTAPSDDAGNPVSMPPDDENRRRFQYGQAPNKQQNKDAGYVGWQNNNKAYMKAYQNYHTLKNTARSCVQTSKEVQRIVPSESKDVSSLRDNQRQLVARTNRAILASKKATAVAQVIFHQKDQRHTNWFTSAHMKQLAAQAENQAENNTGKLLAMPCNNEQDALKLLQECHRLMDEAFDALGLTPLPDGGYRIPRQLEHPKGISSVCQAMAAKNGAYRTLTVTPGKYASSKLSGLKQIYKDAIDSHFETGTTPYAVNIHSSKSPKLQKQNQAMKWLSEQMESMTDQGVKLKDLDPPQRSNALLARLEKGIEAAADNAKTGDTKAIRAEAAQKVKVLKLIQDRAQRQHQMLGRSGSMLGRRGSPDPVKHAQFQLEDAQKELRVVTDQAARQPELADHQNDLKAKVEKLKGKHGTLKAKQDELKGDLKAAKAARRKALVVTAALRGNVADGDHFADKNEDVQEARAALKAFNEEHLGAENLVSLDAPADLAGRYEDQTRVVPPAGFSADDNLQALAEHSFDALHGAAAAPDPEAGDHPDADPDLEDDPEYRSDPTPDGP